MKGECLRSSLYNWHDHRGDGFLYVCNCGVMAS